MAATEETLWAALRAIRDTPPASRAGRGLDAAWRDLSVWLGRRMPGDAQADVRQEALIRVLRHIDTCDATTSGAAAGWVGRIVDRLAIDAARQAQAALIDRAIRARSADEDGLERVAAPEAGEAISDTALEDLVRELEDAIERSVEASHPRALDRIAPRAYARARLWRRLGGATVAEIRQRLDWHAELSDDLISKWIERGQVPLARALELWVQGAPDDRGELGRRLREHFDRRRPDAGQPRPGRRGRSDGAGRRPSVRLLRPRPWGCGARRGRRR